MDEATAALMQQLLEEDESALLAEKLMSDGRGGS
jgi:hypothetical protein